MNDKHTNASGKPDKVVVKQKQTDQKPSKVNLRVNQPLQPTQQSKMTITPDRNVVFNLEPGVQKISIPLSTLQSMKPGQGIPTGQAGCLLVKKENGKMPITSISVSSHQQIVAYKFSARL